MGRVQKMLGLSSRWATRALPPFSIGVNVIATASGSRVILVALWLAVSIVVPGATAKAISIVDSSGSVTDGLGGLIISSSWSYQRFTLTDTVSLTDLSVWLDDRTTINNDDGLLNDFSGVLSWAIVSDASAPTATIIASGTDSSPILTDSGFQNFQDADIVRVDIVMNAVVSPGTYWLGLHEGGWMSAFDGSQIEWTRVGFGGSAAQTQDPVHGPFNVYPYQQALILSGTVVPEPSTAVLLGVGLAVMAARGHRRLG